MIHLELRASNSGGVTLPRGADVATMASLLEGGATSAPAPTAERSPPVSVVSAAIADGWPAASTSSGSRGQGPRSSGRRWGALEDDEPPPPPPLPATRFDVDAQDLAPQLQYTVFDTEFHVRILERTPLQTLTDIVDCAVSRTPHLRRPWYFRVLQHEFLDLPRLQIVLWDDSCRDLRVVPGRFQPGGGAVCTLAIPPDASPLQVLITARRACQIPGSARPSRGASTGEW